MCGRGGGERGREDGVLGKGTKQARASGRRPLLHTNYVFSSPLPPFLLMHTPPSRAKDTRLSSAQKNGPRGSKSSSIYSLPSSPVFAELFCCGAFSGTVDSILD